jgi:hypothetical protein
MGINCCSRAGQLSQLTLHVQHQYSIWMDDTDKKNTQLGFIVYFIQNALALEWCEWHTSPNYDRKERKQGYNILFFSHQQ